MNLEVEQLVVDRLREWLLQKLPARVTTVNATRAPIMRSPLAGDYVVPSPRAIRISIDGGVNFVSATLQGGTRSASAVASDINAAFDPGSHPAGVDGSFLFLTLDADNPTNGAPASTTKVIMLGDDDGLGTNAIFGWDAGGERLQRDPLSAPGWKEVMDGMPMLPDSNGSRFWVVFGDNASVPVDPGPRRDEYTVSVNVGICVPVPMGNDHRNREHLRSAIRCVRECLFIEDNGRTLGNAAGIQLVFERQCVIRSRPTRFDELPNQLFGRANLELNVRVYERQGN